MNAYMNIRVQVMSAQAQAQIKALQAQIAALQKQSAAAGAQAAAGGAVGGAAGLTAMRKWGNQLQWSGRMLQYNFTLPLLLAGGAATKFALDQEKAMTRVSKLYGDTSAAIQHYTDQGMSRAQARQAVLNKETGLFAQELQALEESFIAMSNRYGVAASEVMEVAGAWAAAGASGRQLAEVTDLTMKTMILGEMEAAEATEALIAIQAQYGLNTVELSRTLMQLNAIENQTGIQTKGLVQGFSRAAAVAREAGVDTRHLGAMLAALVPATGTASQAGNALKTVISRLLAPTQEASQVINEMGFNIESTAWQSATATERLEMLSKEWDTMNSSMKGAASAVIASRWQITKFEQIMHEMSNSTGFYQKALDATQSRQQMFATYQRELNEVLESSPARLDQIWNSIKNGMATAVAPLLPYLVYLAQSFANLVKSFQGLPPEWQKFILLSLVALALLGPIIRYLGAMATALWAVGRVFMFFGGIVTAVMGAALSVVGWAFTGILGILAGAAGTLMGTLAAFPAFMTFLGAATLSALGTVGGLAAGILALPGRVAMVGPALVAAMTMWWPVVTGIWVRALGTLRLLWAAFTIAGGVLTAAFWRNTIRMFAMGFVALKGLFVANAASIAKWGKYLVSWPVLIGAAIMGVLYSLRTELAALWGSITDWFADNTGGMVDAVLRAWYALPEGVASALTAVVQIVSNAAMQVYEWLSYLNPFARHSPSLVDNVKNGMKVIGDEFGKSPARVGAAMSKNRAHMKGMEGGLKSLERTVAAQEAVVERWENKLEAANDAIDKQKDKLKALQDVADGWQAKLSDAEDRLSKYASAPLKGMQAMDEQIWQNEWAQTQLNYKIMQMGEAYGDLDSIREKMEGINGAQELLRGTAEALRQGGAGSDILGAYDKEIAKLEQQRGKYDEQTKALIDMQNQLEVLQNEADKLDLTKKMRFDRLQHEIELAANRMQEMSFDEIIAGIRGAQSDIDTYTGKVNRANAAVAAQQQVIDRMESARDKIEDSLDRERDKLEGIKKQYDKINQAVSARKSAKGRGGPEEYVTPGLQNFRNAEKYGGNFPEVGGSGALVRKNWESEVEGINAITEQLVSDTAGMFGGLNPFGPIKRYWNNFLGWFMPKWDEFKGWASTAFGSLWDGLTGNKAQGVYDSISGALEPTIALVVDIVKTAISWGKKLWNLFGPEVKKTFSEIWKAGKKLWDQLGPVLASFGDLIKPMGEALQNVWAIVKPILMLIALRFLAIAKVVWSTINGALGPAFDLIIGIIVDAVKIIRGLVKVIIGIFTGDLGMIWDGVKDIFDGLVGGIIRIIWRMIRVVGGAIWGFVKGIFGFFKWLWDELVGHSIVPDIVDGVIKIFGYLTALPRWLWNKVLKPIWNFFKSLWTDYIRPGLRLWWAGIKTVWGALKKLGGWVWDHVLKPVWNKAQDLWDRVKRGFGKWWGGVKDVWSALKKLGGWVWDHVLKPVWNKAGDLWDRVKRGFGNWWEGIKNVWSSLKKLGGWVKDNVMDPVFDKIKGGWQKVKDWLSNNKDLLTNPVKGVVNVVIGAVNALIKGLNKVADLLPGISWDIDLIPKLAAGGMPLGRRVGSGFKTNGARAIVGEGKANHPEYVIPTDPTHRRRAISLVGQAQRALGIPGGESQTDRGKVLRQAHQTYGGIPMFGIGGMIGNIAKGAWNKLKELPRNAASAAYKPFAATANSLLDDVDWTPPRVIGKYGVKRIGDYIADVNDEYTKEMEEAGKKYSGMGGKGHADALKFAKAQAGKPYEWGGVGPGGYDCSGFMSAITNVIRGQNPHSRVGATGTFPWAGFKSGHGGGFTIGSSPSYSGGVGHMAGTLNGVNVESRGGDGVVIGAAARGWADSGFSEVAHLARGGIVKRTVGGIMARIGEGSSDEAVEPLPRNWRTNPNYRGDDKPTQTHLHFHGNLEFPNITSADDAEALIDSLALLAKD